MVRCLSISLFIFHFLSAHAQPQTAAETVNKYSVAQKRLLVLSTAAFTNLITQNNLDRDSVILMACRITGLPFLIAYDEDYDSLSAGTQLINAGKIDKAAQLLHSLNGQKHEQLLTELATWYLHKTGAYQRDLDSAYSYIHTVLTSNTTNNNLRSHCFALLGEYYRQAGKEAECRKTYLQIISSGRTVENLNTAADAWHRLAKLHKEVDSTDLSYLNNSLAIYRQLQLKEKEIELLWNIAAYHIKHDMASLKTDLISILNLQQSIGFNHSLFAENILAYQSYQQARLSETLEYAKMALENMKWSGISAVEGNFYTRIGAVYESLGKDEEAMSWYRKAIEHGTNETHVFWYKSLFYLPQTLLKLNRTREALSLMQRVTSKFPPLTAWEKGQVFTSMAALSRMLNNDQLADKYYSSFLMLLEANPGMDPYDEFSYDYKLMVEFYLSKSDVRKAHRVAELGLSKRKAAITADDLNNYLLFKIDSATGKYKSALEHYIGYKYYDDSKKEMEERKTFEELTLKYGAVKKDNDIKLLQKEKQLREAMLLQEKNTRNWILGAVALLLIIVGLLGYNSRLKLRTNKKLKAQGMEIENQNNELRHLVTEKDWLVKEIHHRVKNNFQTVMGLLGTQSAYLHNDVAIDAINDSQRRIQSMSLIHQRLYQSNNLSAIEMDDYIHELVNSLNESFNTRNLVRFNFDIEPVDLDLAHCIPIGLILTEAITNSFKYAFPDNQHGDISISLKNVFENSFTLTVRDNGIGLPFGFDINQSGSMGMNLMRGLCSEIGAQIVISGENGTQINIRFTWQPEAKTENTQRKTFMPVTSN